MGALLPIPPGQEFVPFVFIPAVGRSFLRPYISTHHPHHPLLADTLGNSLGRLAAIFMVLAVAGENRRKDTALIALVTIGLVAYELRNCLSGHPVDPLDIAATLIFGAVACALYRLIHCRERPSG